MISSKLHINSKANRRFRRLALNTVITLYFLIVAGGVVRSTGAGMGCPDWPKCFGKWIPPTEASQLPANYKEIYGAKLKGEVEFNATKTWIEYVNRLLGAFTGIMIFLTLLASLPFLKTGNKQIFYFSLGAFILVGFQGWLGAKVVSFELKPVVVTLHMLFAIIIVFVLLYLFTWSGYVDKRFQVSEGGKKALNTLGIAVMGISLLQILLGTQVREAIDEIIVRLGYNSRAEWIDQIGMRFYVHRSFSILVMAINALWVFRILKFEKRGSFTANLAISCSIILGAELVTGLVMAYFGVPPWAQPLHLTLAILLIGLQFVSWLVVNGNTYLKYETSPQVR
ncbi:Heme A synthase [Dyadobacter sp. CECT 9623]|uniref:Heme A synthase n=1 Tax=Dyadobacter linearis TaxID=2823330 RepID=A0ABN7RE57_9BACT|nr:COX15/CtaA family protein [Dyadobacter sp. CECT 9623]CAG5074417.1 Heme A synthase [Dyadobacter sp. CECT 9623]